MSEAYSETIMYIVADTKEDAEGAWLWEDLGEARDYKRDMGYDHIYTVVIRTDFSTLRAVSE